MQGQESEAAYFMRRAREEAHLALGTASPEAAASHYGLSVQYSMQARWAHQAADLKEQSAFSSLNAARSDVVSVETLVQRIG